MHPLMNLALFAGVLVVCIALSAGVILSMLRSGRVGPMDTPNARSLHSRPVPRSGGLGILAASFAGLILSLDWAGWLALAVTALALVSWLDDRHNLPAWVRFAVHLSAAMLLATTGQLPAWGWTGMIVMVLGLAWLTNLYNFMDGADGLAGGMTVFGFLAYALAAIMAGAHSMALLCLAVAGGALGFLFFNFHPARIFMGDVGSIPLGFMAGALGLLGVRDGLWPLPFVLMVFSPFVVDASVTLCRRALRGERLWHAHREHYYQRLVQSGWSHKKMALAWYALMAGTALSGLFALPLPAEGWLLIGFAWACLYAGLGWLIDRHWRQFSRGSRP